MSTPPFKGGQGRSAEEISSTAITLAAIMFGGIILLIVLAVMS